MDCRPTGICSPQWPERVSAPTAASKLRSTVQLMMTRPYRHWLIAAILAALIYYAWGEIMRMRGAQKVSFRPSEEA